MRLLGWFAVLAMSASVMACAAQDAGDAEDSSDESEGELRALDDGDVVGTITYGTERMRVEYPGTSPGHAYRAVRFQGNEGDEVHVTVTADASSTPVIFLVESDFHTLVANVGQEKGRPVEVTSKLRHAGTHYLAVRTLEGSRAALEVSLDKADGGATASAGDEVFPNCDDAPPLVFPTTGTLAVNGFPGPTVVDTTLERTCDANGACTPWKKSATAKPVFDHAYAWLNPDKTFKALSTGPSFDWGYGVSCYASWQTKATLREDGTADGMSYPSDLQCQANGGAFSERTNDTKHAASIVMRAGCMTITDPAPSGAAGAQTWHSFRATW